MVLLKSINLNPFCCFHLNLHSTMVLLKCYKRCYQRLKRLYLHSTMVLLKCNNFIATSKSLDLSTFHYGSIKMGKDNYIRKCEI